VEQVLRELGAEGKPVITALNKIDLLVEETPQDEQTEAGGEEEAPSCSVDRIGEMVVEYPNCVAISAAQGLGLDRLLGRVQELLEEDLVRVHVLLPYSSDGLLGLFHQRGVVEREEFGENGVTLEGKVPQGLAPRFERYVVGGPSRGR
jgi:GTP-binding protein HflX